MLLPLLLSFTPAASACSPPTEDNRVVSPLGGQVPPGFAIRATSYGQALGAFPPLVTDPAGEEVVLEYLEPGLWVTPRDGPLGTWSVGGILVDVVEVPSGTAPTFPSSQPSLEEWSEHRWTHLPNTRGSCVTFIPRWAEHHLVQIQVPAGTAQGWTADLSFENPDAGVIRFPVGEVSTTETVDIQSSLLRGLEPGCATLALVSPLGEVVDESSLCETGGCATLGGARGQVFSVLLAVMALGVCRRRERSFLGAMGPRT